MKKLCEMLLVWGVPAVLTILLSAQESQKVPTTEHPYKVFAQRMETSLRFATDLSYPGGPSFRVKVYEWVIGPRQEIANFPLEGFATIEVKAGEVQTTINGVTLDRTPGEYWTVAEGQKLRLKVKSDTGRGDNIVTLQGVVLAKK